MSDVWDGRPENPERDGWHWLHHPEDLRPVVQPWSAEHGAWISGAMHSPQGVVDLGFYYIGPCLTPDEVAAREAVAAAAEREACAQELDCGCAARADVLARLATDGEKRASYLCVHGDVCCALQAAAIRARGKEVGGE